MKDVIIYCATGFGEQVLYSLNPYEFNVKGFCDGNKEIWGGS